MDLTLFFECKPTSTHPALSGFFEHNPESKYVQALSVWKNHLYSFKIVQFGCSLPTSAVSFVSGVDLRACFPVPVCVHQCARAIPNWSKNRKYQRKALRSGWTISAETTETRHTQKIPKDPKSLVPPQDMQDIFPPKKENCVCFMLGLFWACESRKTTHIYGQMCHI